MIPFEHWRSPILWGHGRSKGAFCCLIWLTDRLAGRYEISRTKGDEDREYLGFTAHYIGPEVRRKK